MARYGQNMGGGWGRWTYLVKHERNETWANTREKIIYQVHLLLNVLINAQTTLCIAYTVRKDFVTLQFVGGCLVDQHTVAEIWSNAW